MRQITRSVILTLNGLPRPHRVMLGMLLITTLVISFWHPYKEPVSGTYQEIINEKNPSVFLPDNSEPIDTPALADAMPWDELDDKTVLTPGRQQYIISPGDSLSTVLNQYGIDAADISRLSKADSQLRNLKIGQQLSWILSANGELQQLSWQVSRKETRHYQRQNDSFLVNSEIQRGEWQNRWLSGRVTGSFVTSAKQAGLSNSEISAVVNAMQWQLDFRKLKKDDKFAVLLSSEMLNGKPEQSELLGVRLRSAGKDYYAIRAEDGRYYDQAGNGLAKGFLRFPTARQYRVSSEFNPRRVHPVTGVVAPHKGVDFAMPSGTPILSVGDGEVIEAKYSPTAGYYLTIRHGRTYTTRYLHLQKSLVKQGQKVKRGERIALSGNTGRSTGAHLHYELWINQQAVNPLTAKLPRTESLTGETRRAYLVQAKQISEQLSFNSQPAEHKTAGGS